MLKSWRLGTLLGFPILLNPTFLALLALVFLAYGGVSGVLVVSLAFVFVLLHELGHAVVARALGVRTAEIELSFLGGAAKMELTSNPRHACGRPRCVTGARWARPRARVGHG
jgi:Zn-dependent protease